MLRRAVIILTLLLPVAAMAATPEAALRDARLRGEATFRFLGFPVYDAALYTPGGQPVAQGGDVALLLKYRRKISAKTLVSSTLSEIKRQGPALPIEDALRNCYRDVGPGDSYLAVSQGPGRLRFWRNGKPTCTLSYPGVSKRFFQIFLGPNSRSAQFSRRLRGQ